MGSIVESDIRLVCVILSCRAAAVVVLVILVLLVVVVVVVVVVVGAVGAVTSTRPYLAADRCLKPSILTT